MSEWPQIGDRVVIHGMRKEDGRIGYIIGISNDRKNLNTVFTLEDVEGDFTTRYRSHISRLNEAAWIEHDGTSWPKCNAMDKVEFILRDGSKLAFQANSRSWAHFDDAEDILCYRVIALAETRD